MRLQVDIVMQFSEFDERNIPYILDLVAPDWSPPNADMAFKRFYAEYTVRHNIWDATFSLQATDEVENIWNITFVKFRKLHNNINLQTHK